jgi:hypothetical protein
LVQEFEAKPPAVVRLSVSRTSTDGERWVDGISWDDLQRIKNAVGYVNACAVEVFPPQRHLVNVAAMRHLWVLASTPDYVWKDSDCEDEQPTAQGGDTATPQAT